MGATRFGRRCWLGRPELTILCALRLQRLSGPSPGPEGWCQPTARFSTSPNDGDDRDYRSSKRKQGTRQHHQPSIEKRGRYPDALSDRACEKKARHPPPLGTRQLIPS